MIYEQLTLELIAKNSQKSSREGKSWMALLLSHGIATHHTMTIVLDLNEVTKG